MSALRRSLAIDPGETTADAKFARSGRASGRGTAPIQLGSGPYVENLTVAKSQVLVDRLKRGERRRHDLDPACGGRRWLIG
jgi:hypothetical protein